MKNGKTLAMAYFVFTFCGAFTSQTFAEEAVSTDIVVVKETGNSHYSIDLEEEEANPDEIADPFYYFNLVNFHFNDKLYYWFFKPVTTGYKAVTPEIVRVGLGNVFSNLRAPVNAVNNLLQFKLDRFGLELFRFVFNSVVGVGGLYDASYDLLDIDKHEADFGQTLGYYGLGQGAYLVWPFLGPSSLRETIGFAGDQMMSPPTYIGYFFYNFWQSGVALTFEKVNDTSFKLGDYELLANSVDPYLALKNCFEQYRVKKIKQARER